MDSALNQALSKATEEICKSVLDWSVQSNAPVERKINESSGETSVIISFMGAVSGSITLKCTRKLTEEIACKMLGMDTADGSEDIKDAIGELLSMIVGTAKAYYSDKDLFKVSIPTTIIGEDYTVHIKAAGDEKISLLDFNCNHGSMSIEVFLI